MNLSQKILLYGFFVSLLLTVHVSIHTQLSVVITVKFTSQFSEKRLRSDCLSSCTVWSLGFLSGLSLYCNNIFIENSFCVVLSKPQHVKLLGKSKQRRHWNLPFSETTSMVSFETVATIFKYYTTHSGVIYSRLTFLRSFSFNIFFKPTNSPLEIAAFNHGFLTQSNSSL